MNFALAVAVILLGGIVQASHAAPRWNAGPDLADLVVSLNERSQILESANKLFEQALTGIHATAKASPRSEVLKSGEVVLWGDLFQTGTCFALAELPSRQDENPGVYGVAFAEW